MKSFIQHLLLQEVGDQPYKWKRTESLWNRWAATFKTDNKQKYVFQAIPGQSHAPPSGNDAEKGQWQVLFHLFGASRSGHDPMGVTGTEGTSAVRVFGTVAQIFEAFVKEVKPENIEFIADKTEGSLRGARSRIYSRFAKKFAAKHGYNLKEKDAGDETVFLFSSKKKGKKK